MREPLEHFWPEFVDRVIQQDLEVAQFFPRDGLRSWHREVHQAHSEWICVCRLEPEGLEGRRKRICSGVSISHAQNHRVVITRGRRRRDRERR